MLSKSINQFDAFFEDQARFGRNRLPLLIVFITGFAIGLQSVAVHYALGDDASALANALTVTFFFEWLRPFVLWIGFTFIFYILAKVFNARLRFGRLFKLVGWGFIPFIFSGVIWAIGRYLVFQNQEVPDGVREGVLSSELDAYESILETIAGEPVLVITTVIGCIFVVGSGMIWIKAVSLSSDLNDRQAHLVAGIPVFLYILFEIYRSFFPGPLW